MTLRDFIRGQFGDTFGPGKYELVTANIPILSDLIQLWKSAAQSCPS